MFSIIAAIGINGEIGKNNNLIWHIPDDMKHFKKVTTGHSVVMGRNTFLSIGKALPNRTNYLVTSKEVDCSNVFVVRDLEKFTKRYLNSEEEIFVIGGSMLYEYFLPYCKKMYITHINKACIDADAFFPEFDKSLYDKKVLNEGTYNDINYQFYLYTKEE